MPQLVWTGCVVFLFDADPVTRWRLTAAIPVKDPDVDFDVDPDVYTPAGGSIPDPVPGVDFSDPKWPLTWVKRNIDELGPDGPDSPDSPDIPDRLAVEFTVGYGISIVCVSYPTPFPAWLDVDGVKGALFRLPSIIAGWTDVVAAVTAGLAKLQAGEAIPEASSGTSPPPAAAGVGPTAVPELETDR